MYASFYNNDLEILNNSKKISRERTLIFLISITVSIVLVILIFILLSLIAKILNSLNNIINQKIKIIDSQKITKELVTELRDKEKEIERKIKKEKNIEMP